MSSVLQVCAFGAPNAGNFIESLTELERSLQKVGIQTIYAFAETARDKEWCKQICKRTKVYFLPVKHARVLLETYQEIKRIYDENDIVIAHSHFELYDIPVTLMAPKNIKIYWHLHDALKCNYQQGKISRKMLTKLQYCYMSKRATLLSVSLEHAEFAKELGFNRDKIIYLPNGICTERIEDASLDKKENVFLMFGWEVIRKGVDLVVSAAKKLQLPKCKILIVGQKECQEYLDQNADNTCIEFLAPVEDINVLYHQAKVFLHVSRAEGLSYALLEAIYAGIPVICSDIPENRFAERFKGVHFVPNEDSTAIATNISLLSEMEEMSKDEIEFNRKIIDENYSLQAWCKRLMNIYKGNNNYDQCDSTSI